MQFMMLIYSRARAEGMDPEKAQALMEAHSKFCDEARAKGILRQGAPLAPAEDAATIRRAGDKTTVTDGPYAETKEQLAGFYILECETLEEAVEWGKKIPTGLPGVPGSFGGAVCEGSAAEERRTGASGKVKKSAAPCRSGNSPSSFQ
jgi:hypothetical protein